jgi:hypothetical protein
MGYSIVNVDEVEPAGPGGAVRFVRRRLGVEAFGVNWFDLREGMTFVAIGARRGAYEPHGPF